PPVFTEDGKALRWPQQDALFSELGLESGKVTHAGPKLTSSSPAARLGHAGKLAVVTERDSVAVWAAAGPRKLWSKALPLTGDCHTISQDGRWLAVPLWKKEAAWIQVWDIQRGREVAIWRVGKERAEGLAFSRDGKTIAAVTEHGTLRLWDT